MKIEDQVCTLEQGKKLVELGVNPLHACLVWVGMGDSYKVALLGLLEDDGDSRVYFSAPAFTVAELDEALIIGDDDHFVQSGYNEHLGCYDSMLTKRDDSEFGFKTIQDEEGDSGAEARAEMLIYLLENKIVTSEEVNARLTQ